MSEQMQPEGPVMALHPRYYRDPEIFAQERERIFYRTWQYRLS